VLQKGCMAKKIVDFKECHQEAVNAFDVRRVLLVSQGNNNIPNVMAIGWGSLGIIWKKPVFTVLVRPSRYTYSLIEESGEFTVNIVAPGSEDIVKYCGTVSGRDVNKIEAKHLTTMASSQIQTPIIEEAILHFECKVIYKNDLVPTELVKPIRQETYGGSSDFHRIYFGEIVACQRD